MGTKYIIEVEDKPFELLSEDGFTSEKLFRVKGFNSLVFDWNGLNMLTHYIEPDLERVKKTAHDDGYSEGYQAGREDLNQVLSDVESDVEQVRKEAYQNGYETGYEDGYNELGKNQQEAYQRGLNDAWEAARKIADMPYGDGEKIFGVGGWHIIEKRNAFEVIEKLKANEQERDAEIKIGDEVEAICGKAVVISVRGGIVYYIYPNGERNGDCLERLKRTGRHFPEIAAIFEKMKNEPNAQIDTE